MRLPIRAKMVIFIGLPALVIAIGALLWILSYVRGQSTRIHENEMVSMTETAASRFDDYISKAARVANTTASFLTLVPDLSEPQLYGMLRENVSQSHRIYGAAIAFEPGSFKNDDSLFAPYVCEGTEGLKEMNLGRDQVDWYGDEKWQWWHLAKNLQKGVWTDAYFDEGAGNVLMITYTVPFFESPESEEIQGAFRGVTTVDIDLKTLHQNIGKAIVGKRDFYIVQPDGKFIFTERTENILGKTIYNAVGHDMRGDRLEIAEKVLGGESGVSLVTMNDGEKRYFAYAPIKSTGWTFVTSAPEKEVLAEFNQILRFAGGAFLIAVLLMGASIIFTSGRLTRPIEDLSRRVLRIANGETVTLGDYHTNDEFEELADAFGTMQEKVADRERELENARETTLHELLESTPDAMLVADQNGIMHRVNSKMSDLFGYSLDALIGSPLDTLIPERYQDSIGEDLLKHFTSPGELEGETEIQGLRSDGSEIPLEVGLSKFHESSGVMTVAAIRDITDRKRYEARLEVAREQAEAANHAKSDFLSHMSHELRTPLNGILGYAQILQRGSEITGTQRGSVDAIMNCGDHLLSLINDVLDLSKIEAGRIEVINKPCDLHKLIIGVGDIVQQRAASKGLTFSMEISPEVPRGIVIDAPKLRQILVNPLGNSVKFTRDGGVVLHVAEEPKGWLRFDVIDTGVGMDEQELEVIFEPFKQVEAGKTEGGTGLGLAITHELVEILDGKVSVSSRKGEGTTFSISLPLDEVDESELSSLDVDGIANHEGLILTPGQDLTILVADDRETNREVLEIMLGHAGFRTILADDGDTALECLYANQVDLVLLDIRMPRMNGIDALKQIRSGAEKSEVPVIAVTASVFPEFREKAIAAGFSDFLGKPFRVAELMRVIARHLDLEFEKQAMELESEMVSSDEPVMGKLSSEMADRLGAALKIRNLTAIKKIAEELRADPQTKALGERIAKLVQGFDFVGLQALLELGQEG